MSKKYKKKKSGTVGLIMVFLILLASVGVIGFISKGFQDWNYENWFTREVEETEQKEKVGLQIISLENTSNNVALTSNTALTLFNQGLSSPIFETVSYIVENNEDETTTNVYSMNRVYRDLGGLKIGVATASTGGNISLDLIDDYTFTHVLIKGRNFYTATENTYSSDTSSISVNEADFKVFTTNEFDNTVMPPLEEKLFTFESAQTYLSLVSSGNRCLIYEIQLWTE